MSATIEAAPITGAADPLDELIERLLDGLGLGDEQQVAAERRRRCGPQPWTPARPCCCDDAWEFEAAWCSKCGHPLAQEAVR